jgi:hypothetical protein
MGTIALTTIVDQNVTVTSVSSMHTATQSDQKVETSALIDI